MRDLLMIIMFIMLLLQNEMYEKLERKVDKQERTIIELEEKSRVVTIDELKEEAV